jgi:type I restriction enzyme, S subunit
MSELPRGWAEAYLPDLVGPGGVFMDGDWVESKDQDPEGDVRLIQLADVGDGVYRNRSSRFLTLAKANDLGCTFLEPGDVLVARMPDPLGRACLFPGDSRVSVTVVDVCIVRPGPEGAGLRWLMHSMNAPQMRTAVAALQKGTTRKRISRGNLARIPVPVPPRKEQERIVAAIDEQFSRLDAGVSALERVRQNLRRMRGAVLQAAVTGRLTNPDIGDELPPGWTQAAVSEVAEVSGGITKSPKRRPDRNPVPFLRVANVPRDGLDLSEVHTIEVFDGELERLRLRRGDLLGRVDK